MSNILFRMVTGRPELQQPTVLEAKFYFFSPFPQHFHILGKIHTEETKCGKFSRAAWKFDVVLNSRPQEILKQKIIQIYHLASIFTQFCAYVRPLQKAFQWTRKSVIL